MKGGGCGGWGGDFSSNLGRTHDLDVHGAQLLAVEAVFGGLADKAPEAALPGCPLLRPLLPHKRGDVVAHRFLRTIYANVTMKSLRVQISLPSTG